jgi:hypothetical protein
MAQAKRFREVRISIFSKKNSSGGGKGPRGRCPTSSRDPPRTPLANLEKKFSVVLDHLPCPFTRRVGTPLEDISPKGNRIRSREKRRTTSAKIYWQARNECRATFSRNSRGKSDTNGELPGGIFSVKYYEEGCYVKTKNV